MKLNTLLQMSALALGLAGLSLRADTVQVSETGVGANETVWINSSVLGNNLHVYAGVLDLTIDGVATTGFCIDPWHWSSSSALTYTVEPLWNAPKPTDGTTENKMGAQAAMQIEQLWQAYFVDGISNATAAALQIKIWQIVDAAVTTGSFSLLTIDNESDAVNAALKGMTDFLAQNPNAPAADLVAITGSGQDYVVKHVPDAGSSLALLGLAFVSLAAFRRKQGVR